MTNQKLANSLVSVVCGVLVSFSLSPNASAQTWYGTVGGLSDPTHLVTIDKLNGVVTDIGPLDPVYAVPGPIAYDPGTDTLYGFIDEHSQPALVAPMMIFKIDRTTGLAFDFKPVNVLINLSIPIYFPVGITADDLAFNPNDGFLYAYLYDNGLNQIIPAGNLFVTLKWDPQIPSTLVKIDPATGNATPLAQSFTIKVEGLAFFDNQNNQLYASALGHGTGLQSYLYRVDASTGFNVLIGPIGVDPLGLIALGGNRIQDFGFDASSQKLVGVHDTLNGKSYPVFIDPATALGNIGPEILTISPVHAFETVSPVINGGGQQKAPNAVAGVQIPTGSGALGQYTVTSAKHVVIEATSGKGTPVVLDGSKSSDPDGDPLSYAWSQGGLVSVGSPNPTLGVTMNLGDHNWVLTVTDPSGASDTDDITIEIVDTTPPDTIIYGATDFSGKALPNGGTTQSLSVYFSVGGSDVVGVHHFNYAVDGEKPARTTSATTIEATRFGNCDHIIEVWAVDNTGNEDTSPAVFTWKVRIPLHWQFNMLYNVLYQNQLLGGALSQLYWSSYDAYIKENFSLAKINIDTFRTTVISRMKLPPNSPMHISSSVGWSLWGTAGQIRFNLTCP